MLRMGSVVASVLSTIYLPFRKGHRLQYVPSPKQNKVQNDHSNHIVIVARVFAANTPFVSHRPNRLVSSMRPAYEATSMMPSVRNRTNPLQRKAVVSFGVPRQPVYENRPVMNLSPTFQYDGKEEVSGKSKTISKLTIRTHVKAKTWASIESPHVDNLRKEVTIEHPNTIVYGDFTLRDKSYNAVIVNFRGDGEFHAVSKNGRWNIGKAKNIGFSNR